MSGVWFDPERLAIRAGAVVLGELAPLVDGEAASQGRPALPGAHPVEVSRSAGRETTTSSARRPEEHGGARPDGCLLTWALADGARFELEIEAGEGRLMLRPRLAGFAGARRLASLGLRFGRVENVRRYLRNGYTSWDGSYFVEVATAAEAAMADPGMLSGHAVTALVAEDGAAAVVGLLRHDRFQTRLAFRFGAETPSPGETTQSGFLGADNGGAARSPGASGDGRSSQPLSFDVETLIDRVPFEEEVACEPILVLCDGSVEEGLRRWAGAVAAASPTPPRIAQRRIAGWCSWYNLYASITEANLREHLGAARAFRDETGTPLDIFLIDDGFTPEMGDWLETKPQFPRGMAPLIADIRAAGFTPGLWIAPFMVGNRSRLFAAHPDWVVRSRATGEPLAPMRFYGEFRWHKRSEEYHVLDVTHPEAEAYIRGVFRVWAREWGAGYFKTDFMHLGSMFGPEEARWHEDGLSRMAIWMRMARLIREEIGEAQWLACGSPIWAPVGLVDAVRIGRDIGVAWKGHYSAESLLRDQTARNFGNGVLWQADPDCILLRDRFHELTEDQVRSLALFAGLAGGVLMTSDHFGELPAARRTLFSELAGDGAAFCCDFPLLGTAALTHRLGSRPDGSVMALGEGDPVIVQRVRRSDSSVLLNLFNTGDKPLERLIPWGAAGVDAGGQVREIRSGEAAEETPVATSEGVLVRLRPHQSRLLRWETR